ncbi:tRNA pseudouridine(38-40) synthase TruA [Corynebacterium caspium]|uniref:tRNA pseudouridine(38-40) synthase TruA n=1 Tax=Corynebacterium caspium TaxID=234828 RepID=UPI00037B1567|nr:tRNA pseudouridine(38-40) synthase TruA [Corynebacterium caspium]WKD59814.1 tRNA pseudouridine synthase A [Corynebacterium caspium DSM 44850]
MTSASSIGKHQDHPKTVDSDQVRLRLDLAYDGTDFHGWAAQKDPQLRTVEGVLTAKLELVLRVPIKLTVAGRTDAGVHAAAQVAHVDIPQAALDGRSIAGDPQRLVRRMAKLLPPDISLRECTYAPAGFDARFSALRRHYTYRITTHPAGPLPTRVRDTATWNRPVEFARLQETADALVGLQDFAAFCRARDFATTIRNLEGMWWEDISTPAEPQLYQARVTADAFCWNMVRSLVGCCMAVAQGQRTLADVDRFLHEKQRSPEIPLAPACGLSLGGVDYPRECELEARTHVTRALRTISD